MNPGHLVLETCRVGEIQVTDEELCCLKKTDENYPFTNNIGRDQPSTGSNRWASLVSVDDLMLLSRQPQPPPHAKYQKGTSE